MTFDIFRKAVEKDKDRLFVGGGAKFYETITATYHEDFPSLKFL